MYKSNISVVLLLIFGVSYLYKLYTLKLHSKIEGNVLGKGNKDVKLKYTEIFLRTTTYIWILLWIFCIVFNSYISILRFEYLSEKYIEILGLIFTAIGVAFFELAIFFMKSSWRVGVDRNTRTALITEGIYKYSRNPAFVGFDLMFIGLFLTYPNAITFIVMCSNLVAIHLQILQEEKFLQENFENDYAIYKKSTPRYLLF
jgi:protein-S-isoprenylcysteine O-methyltransferase Ste14